MWIQRKGYVGNDVGSHVVPASVLVAAPAQPRRPLSAPVTRSNHPVYSSSYSANNHVAKVEPKFQLQTQVTAGAFPNKKHPYTFSAQPANNTLMPTVVELLDTISKQQTSVLPNESAVSGNRRSVATARPVSAPPVSQKRSECHGKAQPPPLATVGVPNYRQLKQDIKDLWKELKIPRIDRQKFALCLKVPSQVNVNRLIAEIKRLETAREARVRLLESIEKREVALQELKLFVKTFEFTIAPSVEDLRAYAAKYLGEVQQATANVAYWNYIWKKSVAKGRLHIDSSENGTCELTGEPLFLWKKQDYMRKMNSDIEFFFEKEITSDPVAGSGSGTGMGVSGRRKGSVAGAEVAQSPTEKYEPKLAEIDIDTATSMQVLPDHMSTTSVSSSALAMITSLTSTDGLGLTEIQALTTVTSSATTALVNSYLNSLPFTRPRTTAITRLVSKPMAPYEYNNCVNSSPDRKQHGRSRRCQGIAMTAGDLLGLDVLESEEILALLKPATQPKSGVTIQVQKPSLPLAVAQTNTLSEHFQRAKSARLIQSAWRDHVKLLTAEYSRMKHIAAIVIQLAWRKYSSKRTVQRLRLLRNSALAIQRWWRSVYHRRKSIRKRRLVYSRTTPDSTLTIRSVNPSSAVAKGIPRPNSRTPLDRNRVFLILLNRSAKCVQKCFRSYMWRKRYIIFHNKHLQKRLVKTQLVDTLSPSPPVPVPFSPAPTTYIATPKICGRGMASTPEPPRQLPVKKSTPVDQTPTMCSSGSKANANTATPSFLGVFAYTPPPSMVTNVVDSNITTPPVNFQPQLQQIPLTLGTSHPDPPAETGSKGSTSISISSDYGKPSPATLMLRTPITPSFESHTAYAGVNISSSTLVDSSLLAPSTTSQLPGSRSNKLRPISNTTFSTPSMWSSTMTTTTQRQPRKPKSDQTDTLLFTPSSQYTGNATSSMAQRPSLVYGRNSARTTENANVSSFIEDLLPSEISGITYTVDRQERGVANNTDVLDDLSLLSPYFSIKENTQR